MDRYDIIIIGSGVGASPAAANLSESGAKICILERGGWWGEFQEKESFPETRFQLIKSLRNINSLRLNKKGIFEFTLMNNRYLVSAASGVGGGSLVIGGFVDEPPRDMWDHYPPEITYEGIQPHYKNIADVIKPAVAPVETQYSKWITQACKSIPEVKVKDARQSISFGSGPDAEESWTNEYGITQKIVITVAFVCLAVTVARRTAWILIIFKWP
ncbi:MAG: hypothetical protein J7L53_05850 [Deltaproteobacteria bacterium]|nr:hypothetical protein [Deltaproteobacteria bacterium]